MEKVQKKENIIQKKDKKSGNGEISQSLSSTPLMLKKSNENVMAFDEKIVQRKKNNTGLPDNLKSGIESLSGHSMDDVKVHYNSSQPTQLNAHAFAQGSDIHLGSGQEKHLAHEAWHVVQQKQGRVQANRQMKGSVNINDDRGLEREADVMGEKALQMMEKNPYSKNILSTVETLDSYPIQKRDVEYINYHDIAKDIHTAISGLGTDEEKVYLALSKLRRNPVAIKNLKSIYKSKYKSALMSDLNDDFSGAELTHVQSLLAIGETADNRKVKTINYSKLAKNIYNAINRIGTDEETVYQSLVQLNNNPILINKLKDKYKLKYKVDLNTAIQGDFSGNELSYTLELLKDKTAKEQVNVRSKEEAKKAEEIIKSIKDDYAIDINSKAGVEAIKKDYSYVDSKVLDQLNTTAWEYKELVALKKSLDNFKKILGKKRKKSKRKGVTQEVTTVGKVDQGIDIDTDKLDATTMGEYFKSSSNFSLFTAGTESTEDFTDNKKQLHGTTVHEITHGFLEYKIPDFVAKTDFWQREDIKSGIVGAEKPITDYGKTSASEDLSEAVMYYFVDKAKLKKDCPKRTKFIKNTIKAW